MGMGIVVRETIVYNILITDNQIAITSDIEDAWYMTNKLQE